MSDLIQSPATFDLLTHSDFQTLQYANGTWGYECMQGCDIGFPAEQEAIDAFLHFQTEIKLALICSKSYSSPCGNQRRPK